jgi:diaminopimelate epimerase
VAAILCGYTDDEITLHLPGGDLLIQWNRENNRVYMTGPATIVFDGEITL